MEKKFDISTIVKEGEEIVISGIGGRFPESDTVDEFANNLYNKVDMIVDDDRRWPKGNKIQFTETRVTLHLFVVDYSNSY